jgi:hypothetical protein
MIILSHGLTQIFTDNGCWKAEGAMPHGLPKPRAETQRHRDKSLDN